MILTHSSLGLWDKVARRVFKSVYRREDDEVVRKSIVETLTESDVALYIHIPFCTGTCWFCPYARFPIQRSQLDEVISKYVVNLRREIRLYGELLRDLSLNVIDVHVGGGTPSLVPGRYWREIIQELTSAFDARPEVAIEANPEDLLDESRVYDLVDAGVTEFSVGFQSFHDDLLARLGRRHSASDSIKALDNLRSAGARYVNIDLMYMIPGETLEEWIEDLSKATTLKPDEITCYPTLVLENSIGYKLIKQAKIPEQPDMKTFKKMMYVAEDFLTARGYIGQEIYGYTRTRDWKYVTVNYEMEGPLLGFGAGAMSFTGGYEYQNFCSVEEYYEYISKGKLPVAFSRRVTVEERAIRYATCRLFICRSLSKRHFKDKFGREFNELIGRTGFKWFLSMLRVSGDITEDEEKISLTRKGLFTAHKITWAFVLNVPCRMVEECLKRPTPENVTIP